MQTIKCYYIGISPCRLVEMTAAYQRDTGAAGLVKGEDYDILARRVDLLQERLNEAEELADRLQTVSWVSCRRNNRLFRWSCLGYLLALGCLTYIFASGSI